MHLSKREIGIHSVPPYIAFIFFPSKQETTTQSGESAYANHGDTFFMNMFHPKADENDKGGSGYQTIDGVNRVKNGVKMNFLSGCFASQTASVFRQVCI